MNQVGKTINRRLCREFVLKVLYAYELQSYRPNIHDICGMIMPEEWQSDANYKQFIFKYIDNVLSIKEQADGLIDDHASNWDIDRISVIDKIVMTMAISELLLMEDVPTKVSINEAIELAKKYAGTQSHSFINGVLDSILKKLISDNLIKKSGRGLIDFSIKRAPTSKN